MIDRAALRRAYRPDEQSVVVERLDQARLAAAQAAEAQAIARALVKAVRGHKAAGLDAFLQAYDLGSEEGVALMCLAEALLRVPDAATADDLIAETEQIGNLRRAWQQRANTHAGMISSRAAVMLRVPR